MSEPVGNGYAYLSGRSVNLVSSSYSATMPRPPLGRANEADVALVTVSARAIMRLLGPAQLVRPNDPPAMSTGGIL